MPKFSTNKNHLMMGKTLLNNVLTEREKAALYYHIFAGVESWAEIYKIANPDTDNNDNKYVNTYCSKWKNSDKVQRFLEQIRTIKAGKELQQKERILKELEQQTQGNSEHTQTEQERRIIKNLDYSDPRNRQRLYNEVIANSGDDYKTKLDAAKVFEQIQRDDREAAKAQKQSKIYLPLRCEQCVLYQKQKKRL